MCASKTKLARVKSLFMIRVYSSFSFLVTRCSLTGVKPLPFFAGDLRSSSTSPSILLLLLVEQILPLFEVD